MTNSKLPHELEERIKQVELDNACNCTERNISNEELESDVEHTNPDMGTMDRG